MGFFFLSFFLYFIAFYLFTFVSTFESLAPEMGFFAFVSLAPVFCFGSLAAELYAFAFGLWPPSFYVFTFSLLGHSLQPVLHLLTKPQLWTSLGCRVWGLLTDAFRKLSSRGCVFNEFDWAHAFFVFK